MRDFAVDMAMVEVIYISDCTICTNSYIGYLGYITDQLQIITQLMKARKYKNGRVQIYFLDSHLSDYSVEFSGDNDRNKK